MLNTITIMGRLTTDPILRRTQTGIAVASFAVACERDYAPQGLERIQVPVLAINSADDFVNPPELPMMDALIGRVPRGRFVLIPASDETRGHGTHSRPQVFGPYLAEFLKAIGKN